jgi:hypothetical protein
MTNNKAEFQPTPADKLRKTAESYLHNAVALGRVTSSRVYYDKLAKKFAGSTNVETLSGVVIKKLSNGDLIVSNEYAYGDESGNAYESTIQADLLETTAPVVTERRHNTETAKGWTDTLDRAAGEYMMDLLAMNINQTYEIETIPTVPKAKIEVGIMETPDGLRDLMK